MAKGKKWTIEEEKYLFSQLAKNQGNLTQVFIKVSEKIGRTPKGVHHHWYMVMRNKKEYSLCFITVGKNSSLINAKNITSNTKIIVHKKTLFQKIINLFKINK